MGFAQTVILAAFAGLTIYLGLPVGRLRNIMPRTQALLTAGAGGVILFLIFDVLQQAVEPVSADLESLAHGTGQVGAFALDAIVFGGSIALGLLSVTWVTIRMRSGTPGTVLPRQLALGTATRAPWSLRSRITQSMLRPAKPKNSRPPRVTGRRVERRRSKPRFCSDR